MHEAPKMEETFPEMSDFCKDCLTSGKQLLMLGIQWVCSKCPGMINRYLPLHKLSRVAIVLCINWAFQVWAGQFGIIMRPNAFSSWMFFFFFYFSDTDHLGQAKLSQISLSSWITCNMIMFDGWTYLSYKGFILLSNNRYLVIFDNSFVTWRWAAQLSLVLRFLFGY